LFNVINDLHAAMMKGQARAVIGELLSKLLAYTRNHFSAEEEMLERSNYPGLTQHRILHRALTKKVEGYVDRYEKGDLSLSSDLAHFLSEWLNTHIQKVDQAYGPFMNEQGVL
jgi:hemerythrin-like metal-binding protein